MPVTLRMSLHLAFGSGPQSSVAGVVSGVWNEVGQESMGMETLRLAGHSTGIWPSAKGCSARG